MRSKRLKTQSKVVSTNGCDVNSNDCQTNTAVKNGDNNETSVGQQSNSQSIEYIAKLCLRCHCKQNDPFDNSTAIWSALFQPKTSDGSDNSDGNRFLATCGANMVCIIDCIQSIERSGKSVVARYIDANKEEEFVSLAWSVVPICLEKGDPSETLILAVGGKTTIHLLSDMKGYHCFEKVKAHSDQINALLFAQNDLLFSASYDMYIKLWRISRPNDTTSTQLLRSIDTKDNLLSLCYSNRYQTLVASGGKGLFFWLNSLELSDSSEYVSTQMKTKSLVDGITAIPEDEDIIAIRIHSTKYISIIDLKKVIEETHKMDDKSENKSILFSKVLKAKLESFDFEYPFIYLSARKNLLLSGGPNGQIWVYDTNRLPEYYGTNKMVRSDRVFEWPSIENICKDDRMIIDDKKPVIVNTVAISPDLKFMIACTSMNLICIWHKT